MCFMNIYPPGKVLLSQNLAHYFFDFLLILILGKHHVFLEKYHPRRTTILRGVPRLSRIGCQLCEENIVNSTFAFSSPNTDYQLLDTEGSGIGHNYSFWASRCTGMISIILLHIKLHRYDIYISTGYQTGYHWTSKFVYASLYLEGSEISYGNFIFHHNVEMFSLLIALEKARIFCILIC